MSAPWVFLSLPYTTLHQLPFTSTVLHLNNSCQLLLTKLISCCESIGNYSARGNICSIVVDDEGGGQTDSNFKIVILCRSVNELVSRVMDDLFYSLLASKHLAVFLFGLVLHPKTCGKCNYFWKNNHTLFKS